MPPLVAIVDDEEPVRKALARLLRSARLDTEGFDSCERFLESLSRREPSCLVLDLHLPGMSGFELLQELRVRGIALATIVITAHDDSETRLRCMDAGVIGFLRKPIDSTVLLSAVIRALIGNKTTMQ